MRPTNRLQREVDGIADRVKLTDAQRRWGEEHVFQDVIYQCKSSRWCTHCGKIHSTEEYPNDRKYMVCPHCGKRSEVRKTQKRYVNEAEYFLILDTLDTWQVVRLLLVIRDVRKGEAPIFTTYEVGQRWLRPNGDRVVRELPFVMNGVYYGIPFNLKKELTIKKEAKCQIGTMPVYPHKKLLKEYAKYGITNDFHRLNPLDILEELPHNNMYETLYKCGHYKMLGYFISWSYRHNIKNYWNSIRICLRHGYQPSDTSVWCDMIDALKRLKMDDRNPLYVCPSDLTKTHDAIMDKLEKKIEKEEEEKRQRQCAEYITRVAPYLGLLFKDKDLEIFVLPTVKDIKQEGDYLHHCIYKMSYFNKEGSLLLTARVNGERTESIEYDIEKDTILQCHGDHNKNTIHHDRILRLMESNKKHIRAVTNTIGMSVAV